MTGKIVESQAKPIILQILRTMLCCTKEYFLDASDVGCGALGAVVAGLRIAIFS
jgi:hypothetical protein